MRPDMQLDYAVFQLTANRTRCELHIAAQGMTYKLASGLLKPFVAHLSAAEEQIAGGGYTIRLDPPDPGSTTWFTKGTMERFVRFVSTPEILERVGAVEMELMDIEETIRAQTNDASEEIKTTKDQLLKLPLSSTPTGGVPMAHGSMEKPPKDSIDGAEMGMEEARKQQLLRYLDARQIMLQKEQETAFVRAMAAGFKIEQIEDLMLFAENFGALRLREACTNFMVSFKKRQESGLQQVDIKLAAETAQAEMAFSNDSREPLSLQGRGVKQDEFRRASLPGDARLVMGDSGLEKLTRRGSLDELTGEFWQVAARMRAAGMVDAVTADWSSNWQMAKGGRILPTREGTQAVTGGYLGINSEIQISESGSGPVRGHTIMPAWHGNPQNHLMHSIHPLPLHPSLPSPLEMSRPGLPYAPFHGNPYMAQAYVEANGWQMPPSVPPAYWSGHHGYNCNVAPSASEHEDRVLQTQNQGVAEFTPLKNDEIDEERFASARRPASDQLDSKVASDQSDSKEKEQAASIPATQGPASDMLVCKDKEQAVSIPSTQGPASDMLVCKDKAETVGTTTQRPASDMLVCKDKAETVGTTTQRPACDVLVCEDARETVSTPTLTAGNGSPVRQSIQDQSDNKSQLSRSVFQEHEFANKMPLDENGEPLELMRRLPIRSSSPSRRAASPARKVQIGRSGPKRSGIVIRNITYTAQNTQDQREREKNDRELSGSWSEDNEDTKNDKAAQPGPVRARVQDVIGLFESKKDSNESNVKPLKKESRRLRSENSVLSKWESAALRRDANDAEQPVASNRDRSIDPGTFAHSTTGIESRQPHAMRENNEQREATAEEDTILDVRSTAVRDEQGQDADRKLVSTGESFITPEGGAMRRDVNSSMLDINFKRLSMVGCSDQPFSDDSFIVFEQPVVGKEANWKMPSNQELEVPKFDGNCDVPGIGETPEHGDVVIVPDQSRSSNMPEMQVGAAVTDDTLADQEHVDQEESPSRHDVQEHVEMGDSFREANSRKVSERDAKAQAMQEMLERRKAASGNRPGKPNPLAEAQLRAEKLRAYKAGLQKSKQEKEEEEKKRIEDLKSQRKERIAARGSPVATAASHSPSSRPGPRASSLGFSKSSQTLSSQKLSSSSPRGSIDPTAAALSPNVPKSKAASANKLPRNSGRGTTKGNENALSRSVPSLSEVKKESDKGTLALRSSTGSQRLSLLKKSLKDADPNASPNTYGTDDKKHFSPLAVVRKGIPPAKDIKGESLSVAKATKGSNVVTKQSKKLVISPKGLKPSLSKEHALETQEFAASVEQTNTVNTTAVEAFTSAQRNEAGADDTETRKDIIENNMNNEIFSIPENDNDSGYTQIRAPASTGLEEDLGTASDSNHPADESKLEQTSSDEALEMAEEPNDETLNAEPSACSAREHPEAEDDNNAGEPYHASIALVSPVEDNSANCNEMDDHHRDALSISPTVPLAEDYNPSLALPSLSPLHTPSKNLPRLLEAMQQAHSPESNPEVGGLRKKQGDSGSQKASKDHHAKGLKRLLLLGRKSHRSSTTQNLADWVTVSITSDADDEGEEVPTSIGKSAISGSVTTNVDGQVDKLRRETNPGSSSGKGTRSFFSLSNFRGKSDGKS